MNITLEPTNEMYDAPINGQLIPVRIWRGHTAGGIPIEAYVLTITPMQEADAPDLRRELPPFMGPTRERYRIDVQPDLRAVLTYCLGALEIAKDFLTATKETVLPWDMESVPLNIITQASNAAERALQKIDVQPDLRTALEKISITASLIQVDPPATAKQLEAKLDSIADFADQTLEEFDAKKPESPAPLTERDQQATRQEHDDLAPHEGCTCKLCVALRKARDWEEAAGSTATVRDDFARALVEIETVANRMKTIPCFMYPNLSDPGNVPADFFDQDVCWTLVRDLVNKILALCAGSIVKTANPRVLGEPESPAPLTETERLQAVERLTQALRPITNAEQHKIAMARIEELMPLDPEPNTVEGAELIILAALVEAYEKENYKF